MTKTYCDRCGTEGDVDQCVIKPAKGLMPTTRLIPSPFPDLCAACWDALRAWLKAQAVTQDAYCPHLADMSDDQLKALARLFASQRHQDGEK